MKRSFLLGAVFACAMVSVAVGAERPNVLLLIADDLARLRYNPFFELIKERLVVSFLRSTEY